MKMRYPVEDGDAYQERVRQRKQMLKDQMGWTYEDICEIVQAEFAHLMSTKADLVTSEDPANSKQILEQFGCTDSEMIRKSIEFYQQCDSALVKEIPMKTFQKFRYGSGKNGLN